MLIRTYYIYRYILVASDIVSFYLIILQTTFCVFQFSCFNFLYVDFPTLITDMINTT